MKIPRTGATMAGSLRLAMWKISLILLVATTFSFSPLFAQFQKQSEMSVEGKLLRAAGIGGESTGWMIRLDAEVKIEGKTMKSIEVSGPKDDLAKLENKHVDAVGRIVLKRGIERGEWPVLEISAIHEEKKN